MASSGALCPWPAPSCHASQRSFPCTCVCVLEDCSGATYGRVAWEEWALGAREYSGRYETELSFFGYHGTDAVCLKGTVL